MLGRVAASVRIRKGAFSVLLLAGGAVAVLLFVLKALFTRQPEPNPDPGLTAHLKKALAGHSKHVWQVAFSPDGRFLASGSVDRTVKLWRLPEGVLVQTLTQPQGITSLAFSPDGQYLATGSYDKTVMVWRLSDGVGRILTGHSGTVWSVAFSPDGRRLASGGEDRTVRLWRLSDGASLQTLAGHSRIVWSVAFSADGLWLASGSFDTTVKLWRTDTGALARTLEGHSEAVVELAFSPDSEWLASASDDSSVKLWRVKDGALTKTLAGGSEHVYAVAFSPDGQWLASGGRERGALGTLWKQIAGNRLRGGEGRTIRLWQARDGVLQQAFSGHSGDVHSVAFSPDGAWLACGGEATTVTLWRLERRSPH
jgi:WD40 repeat protein